MERLFDVEDVPEPEKLSRTQMLTVKNRRSIESGKHPATGLALHEDPELRCGSCTSCLRLAYHNRSYVKCEKHRLGVSHSENSDIRVGWPACTAYEPGDQ